MGDRMLDSLDRFYAAAEGQARVTDALREISDLFGYQAASLEVHNVRTHQVLSFESTGIDPSDGQTYLRDFARSNPRVGFLKTSKADIAFDHLFLTETQMDKDRFYADFLRPRGLRYFLSLHTPVFDREIKVALTFQRNGHSSGADTDSIALLQQTKPHFLRALRLFWAQKRTKIPVAFRGHAFRALGLTPSERNLAIALSVGTSLSDYGAQKRLSMNTIYTHYKHLKEKLECRDRVSLALRLSELTGASLPPV